MFPSVRRGREDCRKGTQIITMPAIQPITGTPAVSAEVVVVRHQLSNRPH